jgi:hypothetical protein
MVRERIFVLPDGICVLRHEDDPRLTLITYHGYDYARDSYRYRLVV